MRQGRTADPIQAQALGANGPDDVAVPARRPRDPDSNEGARSRWLREPKTAIWFALAAVVLIGGGRRLAGWWQARKAVLRLGEADVTPEEIECVAEHGRAGVYELLRIFSSPPSEPARIAAGRALTRLWLLDQLVAEEEKAIVRRGYTVAWSARRRYPRALRGEVPITVAYNVPFLEDGGRRVGPANLEWSHRVLGAQRAATEEFSPWAPGPGRVTFSIFPGDFDTNGPHRLVLQTRVRTAGLTDSWELEPPHEPFQFELDPSLRLDAILSLPDVTRDELVTKAIHLERGAGDSAVPTYLSLGDEWTIRNPPYLSVRVPLPSDLAHTISIELEGIPGQFSAGSLLVSGQGLARQHLNQDESAHRRFDLGPVAPLPHGMIERPGPRRMRVTLEPALDHGWANPDIRSIWPGRAETNWIDVEIVRR